MSDLIGGSAFGAVSTTSDGTTLGSRQLSASGCDYVYVCASGACATGNILYLTSAASNFGVTTAITSLNWPVGLATTSATSGQYLRIKRAGYDPYALKSSGVQFSGGAQIVGSADDAGYFTWVASGTASTSRCVGVTINASASGTSAFSGVFSFPIWGA